MAIVEELPPGDLTPSLRAVGLASAPGARRSTATATTASAGFLAAAGIFEEIERPFELAVVRLEHAEWLVANGRSAEAEPLLDEARAIFERLRATPWLERIDRVELAPAEPAVVD